MTGSASPTSLCQRALAAIGGKSSISSVFPSDGSPSGNACNLLYTPTYEGLARAAWWDCLSSQATLSLLGAAPGTPEGGSSGVGLTPPIPWLYIYSRPPDCLKARSIVPTYIPQATSSPDTTANNAAPLLLPRKRQIPFKAAYSKDTNGNPLEVILTNQSEANLNYIVNQPNPTIWDSQFESAFVASLAAFLVPALALNLPLMNLQIQVAERMIAEARASDANEGSNCQDNLPDWIAARAGGSGGWYENWGGVGYDEMMWPSIVG